MNYKDELELQFLDPAEKAARFIDDAELRRQWEMPERVWLVARRDDAALPTMSAIVAADGVRSIRSASNSPP